MRSWGLEPGVLRRSSKVREVINNASYGAREGGGCEELGVVGEEEEEEEVMARYPGCRHFSSPSLALHQPLNSYN